MNAVILAILSWFSPGKGDTGLGLIAGNPTGISFKYFTSTTTAIDAAAAWSFSDEWIMIHTDYLWHSFGDIEVIQDASLVLRSGRLGCVWRR